MMRLLWAAVWVSLSACAGASKPGMGDTGERDFPEEFLWGAAMAGFQVDPGCPTLAEDACVDDQSDWYQWVTDPELVAEGGLHLSGEPLSAGPGHWELYPEDFDLAANEVGLNSLRVSLEWSRLFPTEPPADVGVEDLGNYADPEAVEEYHRYLDALEERGLVPLVTLNHYTLPLWLHDGKECHEDIDSCSRRGWADGERMKAELARYSGWCAREYGENVDLWATLNEPFAVVLAGYLLPSADRTNPPGVIKPALAVDVFFSMVEAHAAMYDAVHAWDSTAQVGAVPNLAAIAPHDPDREADVLAVEHMDYVYNRLFLEATVYGHWDRDVDGIAEEERPDLAGRMDFIGVNYYTRLEAQALGTPLIAGYPWIDFIPVGSFWNEYPEGLGEVARLAGSYGVPVYITENGTSVQEDATERFFVPHLESLQEAMRGGVDVRGYYVWSLIDNYEWNHGMNLRFGLYEVDINSKARVARPFVEAYGDLARTGILPR